mgnify:CR=1 FL=1
MAELVSIAAFATFAEAAAVARELAIKNQRQTGIERAGNKWAVVIAPDLLARLRAAVANENCDDEGDFDDFADVLDDKYSRALDEEYEYALDDEYADTAGDIVSEMVDAQENWERSDEEGWFYAD